MSPVLVVGPWFGTRRRRHLPVRTRTLPGVLKTAGLAAAAVDKVRDTATGRGKD